MPTCLASAQAAVLVSTDRSEAGEVILTPEFPLHATGVESRAVFCLIDHRHSLPLLRGARQGSHGAK